MADKSLNKTELVAAVAAASGQSQAAVGGVLDAFFATVADTVSNGGKVTIPGWLAAERTETAARTAATRRPAPRSRSRPATASS